MGNLDQIDNSQFATMLIGKSVLQTTKIEGSSNC